MSTKPVVPYAEEQIALGPFCVDLANTRLFRGGNEVELRPRAFRALQVLLQNPGQLVHYEHMIRDAWDGVCVSKHTVAVTVGEIKEVLAECGAWITCQRRFGYRLEIPGSEDLIVTGRHFRNQFTRTGFENALRCFEQAAKDDSADFRAFGAMANIYLMCGAFLLRRPCELHRQFLGAYEQAVASHAATPELRLDHAYAQYVFEGDLAQAEAELLNLHKENALSAELYARLAMVYMAQGRLDKALAQMKQARTVDVLVPPLTFVGTRVYTARREFNLAIANGKNSLDLHPASQFGRLHYAEALEHAGENEEAIAQYRFAISMAPDVPWMRANAARFLAKIGHWEEATRTLEELRRNRAKEYVDAYHLSLLLHALGRHGEALQELERAKEERSYMLLLLDVDPKADPLRQDPRFKSSCEEVRAGTRGVREPATL
jgi:tetratricopeptide (TPR) repeat protein